MIVVPLDSMHECLFMCEMFSMLLGISDKQTHKSVCKHLLETIKVTQKSEMRVTRDLRRS